VCYPASLRTYSPPSRRPSVRSCRTGRSPSST
jgi:hypothetical protein